MELVPMILNVSAALFNLYVAWRNEQFAKYNLDCAKINVHYAERNAQIASKLAAEYERGNSEVPKS